MRKLWLDYPVFFFYLLSIKKEAKKSKLRKTDPLQQSERSQEQSGIECFVNAAREGSRC